MLIFRWRKSTTSRFILIYFLYSEPGIHVPLGPRTARCELLRYFSVFIGPQIKLGILGAFSFLFRWNSQWNKSNIFFQCYVISQCIIGFLPEVQVGEQSGQRFWKTIKRIWRTKNDIHFTEMTLWSVFDPCIQFSKSNLILSHKLWRYNWWHCRIFETVKPNNLNPVLAICNRSKEY